MNMKRTIELTGWSKGRLADCCRALQKDGLASCRIDGLDFIVEQEHYRICGFWLNPVEIEKTYIKIGVAK